jgi:site-specific recombinase XerD
MARKLEHEARQLVGKNWKKGSGTTKKLLSNIKGISRFMESQGLQSIKHMKSKHVQQCFDHLKAMNLVASTMQNHATAIRFIAAAIGKKNIVPRTNRELGIIRTGRYSPKTANIEKHNQIRELLFQKDVRLGVAHDLREAFGLRAQESITARIAVRNGEEFIRVVGKGGRIREIRINTDEKRAAADSMKKIALAQKTPGIIPANKTLKQFYTYQKNVISRLGGTKKTIANMHTLRHHHVQDMQANGVPLDERLEENGHDRPESEKHYA